MKLKLTCGCAIVFCCIWSAVFGVDTTLKNRFKDNFLIGTAINANQFHEKDIHHANLIKTHFNSITSENVLKWESVHPAINEYAFEESDQFVRFGEKNQLVMIGHVLIWHQQTPVWVFEDEQGNAIDRVQLLERMREHIYTVVGRYKGQIYGWDVLNEALNEDGTLRASQWLTIIGEDYIIKAFQFAHEADPDAKLYYNDYGLTNELKRAAALNLIVRLQEHGIPTVAIGLQEHNTLDWPLIKQIEDTIGAFAEHGIKVNITELDVDVLPQAWHLYNNCLTHDEYTSLNPYAIKLPDAIDQALATRYVGLFKTYLKYSNVIERVTFWGVTDRDSWLNDIPLKGRTNYPLLFDRLGQPKTAFDIIISLISC